ncbi:hypothetical protein [Pedobacter sp. NJ-S-72]
MVNQITEIKEMTSILVSTIKEALVQAKNEDADYFLKYHGYWSILHGLVSIQMIENSGKTDAFKKMILKDAISGFCRSLAL